LLQKGIEAMTIHLPADVAETLRSKVEAGRFASEEAAVTEAVRLLLEREGKEPESKPAGIPAWQQIRNAL
jgi:Arc/MetJ-type ribon-helix-helix transcriptional regulator